MTLDPGIEPSKDLAHLPSPVPVLAEQFCLAKPTIFHIPKLVLKPEHDQVIFRTTTSAPVFTITNVRVGVLTSSLTIADANTGAALATIKTRPALGFTRHYFRKYYVTAVTTKCCLTVHVPSYTFRSFVGTYTDGTATNGHHHELYLGMTWSGDDLLVFLDAKGDLLVARELAETSTQGFSIDPAGPVCRLEVAAGFDAVAAMAVVLMRELKFLEERSG